MYKSVLGKINKLQKKNQPCSVSQNITSLTPVMVEKQCSVDYDLFVLVTSLLFFLAQLD